MRLSLDENLPKRLKQDFPEHEVYPVRDNAWNGIKNGLLLKLVPGGGLWAENTNNSVGLSYINDIECR